MPNNISEFLPNKSSSRRQYKSFSFINILTVLSLILLFGCNQNSDSSKQDRKAFKEKLDIEWINLSTAGYTVKYIQLDFKNYPSEEMMEANLLDNVNSDNVMVLTQDQIIKLARLVTDSSNFSNGECGTFHLNAGFVIEKEAFVRGIITIGCGFNQWEFQPDNTFSKFGALNDDGFDIMTKLLDEINLENKEE